MARRILDGNVLANAEYGRLVAERDRHRARLLPFCLIWGSVGYGLGGAFENWPGGIVASSIGLVLSWATLVVVFRYVRWLSRTSRNVRSHDCDGLGDRELER